MRCDKDHLVIAAVEGHLTDPVEAEKVREHVLAEILRLDAFSLDALLDHLR